MQLKRFFSILFLLALLTSLLTACSSAATETETKEESKKTQEKTTQEEVLKSTVEQEDPAADGELDVLIIGNSFSTGWPDELKGMFGAAGLKLNIYTVYYSGCSLQQHWDWMQEGVNNYRLGRHINDKGKRTDQNDLTLLQCLAAENWDVISLQQHFGVTVSASYDTSIDTCTPYAKNLFDFLKWNFPKSKLVFHQTWAYEIGWERDGVAMADKAQQDISHENIRKASQKIAKDNNVPLIPCGDAWFYARQSSEITDLTRDKYHDGSTGGGQLLNACVWYESLTGKSCLDNTWRPTTYDLNEYKVAAIKEAAHRAVEENTIK